MTTPSGAVLNTQGFGNRPENVEIPHVDVRNPSSLDTGRGFFPIGKRWINRLTNNEYSLTSFSSSYGVTTANWTSLGSAAGDLNTLTGDAGGPLSPSAGNINILGGNLLTVAGSGSTLTINTDTGGYPVTPYVVGPIGQAGYQTIQSALNAAGITGVAQVICIQPGTYTENLTFPNVDITLWGDRGANSILVGHHTPSNSANLEIHQILLVSTTDILNSSGSGVGSIEISDSFILVTDGFVFNLPNWTGEFLLDDCGEASTNDGVVNNTAGAPIKFLNTEMGAGSGRTMTLTGNANVRFDTCNVNCPVNIAGSGAIIFQNGCKFANTVTIGGSKSGDILETAFISGSAQALVMNSSGNINLDSVVFDSTNNPAIGGTGIGVLKLTTSSFINNALLAGTLTLGWGTTKTGALTATGNLTLGALGNKIIIPTGSNASAGTSSAMSGTPGVIAVATTACSATAKVFYSRATTGGTPGQVSITAQDGTGFTLTSTGNETSTFNWWIINA